MEKVIKGELILTVSNQMGIDTVIQIFNPLKNQSINNNRYFFNPLLSSDGIVQSLIAGNIFGTVGFDRNGSYFAVNPTNTGNLFVSSEKYPYNQFLDYLKTVPVFISEVVMKCTNAAQLNQEWLYIQSYPDGTVKEAKIDNSNIVAPDQVQPGIAKFNLNKVIDKFTGIDIQVLNGASLILVMKFETIIDNCCKK